MPFVGGPDTRITNPRWRTAAILEKLLYLGRGLTDFDKIWHALQFNACDASHSYNFAVSKIQHGGGRHFEKNEKFSSQTREIEKRAYYQNYCIDSSQFQLFQRNLAG